MRGIQSELQVRSSQFGTGHWKILPHSYATLVGCRLQCRSHVKESLYLLPHLPGFRDGYPRQLTLLCEADADDACVCGS